LLSLVQLVAYRLLFFEATPRKAAICSPVKVPMRLASPPSMRPDMPPKAVPVRTQAARAERPI